jgi:hypothetical protein
MIYFDECGINKENKKVFKKGVVVSAIVAVALSGCVSIPERPLSSAEIANWRISEIKVGFAPDATVNLPNRLNAYVNRELPKVAPELVSLPVDPANPERNAYAEKALEIAQTPQAKSAVRVEGVEAVRERYVQAFSAQPSGKRPVLLVVTINNIAESGDAAAIDAKTRFVDPKTGQTLMEGLSVRGARQSRPVVANSLAGLAAVVVVNAVITAVENRSGSPLTIAVDESANNLKTWLLKKEGE